MILKKETNNILLYITKIQFLEYNYNMINKK